MAGTLPGAEYQLIGAYTRYSSWTARVVTLLEFFQIPYKTRYFNIYEPHDRTAMLQCSPSGFVPVLIVTAKDSGLQTPLTINDSLAICEFLAENHPALPLWPHDPALRALARSAAAEMHSGFSEVRNTYHSSFVARYEGPVPVNERAKAEVERLLELWGQCRRFTVKRLADIGKEVEDGGWLFGKFGIADSFFWPVLWRFRSYNLPLDTATPEALAWMRKMWEDPCMQRIAKEYHRQAEDPVTLISKYDDIFKEVPGVKYSQFTGDWKFEG